METFGALRIKWTYSTHLIDHSMAAAIAPMSNEVEPGDAVLARIMEIGRNKEVEAADGRRTALFPGDVIAGVIGHRYATDQFEGCGRARGPVGHLLGMGGVCGELVSKNERVLDPTPIEWIGRLADARDMTINTRLLAGRPPTAQPPRPRTLLVVGASMNAGKTTTAAQAIRSLSGDGRRVSAAKLTGTACRKDVAIMEDAGALRVLDFTDRGHPSTARCRRDELLRIAADLRAQLLAEQPEFLVYEIADGILQRETQILLADPGFHDGIDLVAYAAPDSPSCDSGVRRLRDLGYSVAAVAGPIANSPLGIEEVQASTGVPCLSGEMILAGALLGALAPASVA